MGNTAPLYAQYLLHSYWYVQELKQNGPGNLRKDVPDPELLLFDGLLLFS